jgi:uncharacterized protein YecT (DUF1311 family)
MRTAFALAVIFFISGSEMALGFTNEGYFSDCSKKEKLGGILKEECESFIVFKKADSDLNLAYTNYLARLRAAEVRINSGRDVAERVDLSNRFVQAQEAWIVFRDLTCTFEAEDKGRESALIELNCRTERAKSRLLDLQKYLSSEWPYP